MSLVIELFIAALALGYLLTKALIHYAHKKQLLDVANYRSSHTQATPRIGGLSFVVVISVLLIGYGLFITPTRITSLLLFVLLPIFLVALTGLIDDIKGIRQSRRFMLYLFSALLAAGNLSPLFAQPYWIIVSGSLILSISICWLINLFNFMDGIDGLAASEAIFVICSSALFAYIGKAPNWAILQLTLAGPLAGFLILNWQPAKIFMGDVGSTFLGILLSCILLINMQIGALNLWSGIILLGTFITDASWTLFFRFITKQKWYDAHRSHMYQILSRRMSSHAKVNMCNLGANVFWLLPLSYCANILPAYGVFFTLIALLPFIWLCITVKAGSISSN